MRSILFAALLLAGCATGPVKTEFQEVLVPVTVGCVTPERPEEVKAVNEKIGRQQWDLLTTDQREKLLLANALERKAYGDKLFVATSGCPEVAP